MFNDDSFPTDTSILQKEIEELIINSYEQYSSRDGAKLKRLAHERFLFSPLYEGLNRWFVALDASKPWLIYWILQSLDLLGVDIPSEIKEKAIATLITCQHIDGGFSGGKGQISHLATTYAAVSALAIIGTEEAFKCIDRASLYRFLLSMKQPDGSFRMHQQGEIDIRGSYCALNTSALLNILTPELVKGTSDFISRCQTYEGGLGPFPGVESHGGYTFCGLAALCLVGEQDKLDLDLLCHWIASRQMACEGGFQGRTNKLVDGCYSFWQGGAGILMECILKKGAALSINQEENSENDEKHIIHEVVSKDRLVDYIQKCCQAPNGGLRDKPGKSPDFYHSCYCLSGLSLCQNVYSFQKLTNDILFIPMPLAPGMEESNRLKPTHPIHNIGFDCATRMKKWFQKIQ